MRRIILFALLCMGPVACLTAQQTTRQQTASGVDARPVEASQPAANGPEIRSATAPDVSGQARETPVLQPATHEMRQNMQSGINRREKPEDD